MIKAKTGFDRWVDGQLQDPVFAEEYKEAREKVVMTNATPAFILIDQKVNWKTASEDLWNMDVIELNGNEKIIGHRRVEETIYKVLLTEDNKIVAIAK